MSIYAAVDSNALTYLVNAIGVEGYDPGKDSSGLADERVAGQLRARPLQIFGFLLRCSTASTTTA